MQDDLKITGDDLVKVIDKFPEVINCKVDLRLKANVAHMQKVTSFLISCAVIGVVTRT